MFGFRFIKVPPTTHILQYRGGKVVREGAGLSFFYYAPTSSLVSVPTGSTDVPFIFNELTSDFQEVSVQGQVTYRITNAKQIASLLNFTLDAKARSYVSDDPAKLQVRVINLIRVFVRKELQDLALRQAVQSSEGLVKAVTNNIQSTPEVASLGLEILGVAILGIRPSPETARALEAEAREELLKQADSATYARRNASVEQERAIKENELNTEIAVETKKRQIRETQMDAERSVQEKQHLLETEQMEARIGLEQKNRSLVELQSDNARLEADAKAYALDAILKTLSSVDPKTLQALTHASMQPGQLIAQAFTGIAEKAEKIGELNISPELLSGLMKEKRG